MAKKTPEINAGSMADIAFLLLIFFLVSATMNVDSGILRILPPMPEEEQLDESIDIKERNILLVFVSAANEIMVGGQKMDIHDLKDKVKDFVVNPTNDVNLPEKVMTEIELLGTFPVSSGIVSLTNDRGTSYDMYIKVQNELTRAFNEIRNELSNRKFGKDFSDLADEPRKAIQAAVPLKISEAEPRNVGGA